MGMNAFLLEDRGQKMKALTTLTNKRRRGFSLLEVVLGLAFLAVILVTLIAVFTTTSAAILNSKENERKVMTVLSSLEQMEGVDFDKLVSTYNRSEDVGGAIITTTVNKTAPNSAEIIVTAAWTSVKGIPRTLTLKREVSKYAKENVNETPVTTP